MNYSISLEEYSCKGVFQNASSECTPTPFCCRRPQNVLARGPKVIDRLQIFLAFAFLICHFHFEEKDIKRNK